MVPAQPPSVPLPTPPEFQQGGKNEPDQLGCAQLSCPVLPQGRNASEQVKMLQRIEQHNARQPPEKNIRVSVEVEKPRQELFQLFGYGDVVSLLCSFCLPTPLIWFLQGA